MQGCNQFQERGADSILTSFQGQTTFFFTTVLFSKLCKLCFVLLQFLTLHNGIMSLVDAISSAGFGAHSHNEHELEHSLFLVYLFFLLSLDFQKGTKKSKKQTKNTPFHACSGNKLLSL